MLVSIRNVSKRYGGAVPLEVLHGVNLQVDQGELVALMGPSGAGKTTLLNIISTLDAPSEGVVIIASQNVHTLGQAQLNRFRNRNLGFVFQDDLLLPHLTALENVMLPGRLARMPYRPLRKRAKELLALVGLADREEHRPGQLSGGQRQRVNLARSLVNQPPLLLADEPTARLDRATGQGIIELLVDLNKTLGVTIIMVTHEPSVAARAKRVVKFLDGAIESDSANQPSQAVSPSQPRQEAV